jgi:hypothetical protein
MALLLKCNFLTRYRFMMSFQMKKTLTLSLNKAHTFKMHRHTAGWTFTTLNSIICCFHKMNRNELWTHDSRLISEISQKHFQQYLMQLTLIVNWVIPIVLCSQYMRKNTEKLNSYFLVYVAI